MFKLFTMLRSSIVKLVTSVTGFSIVGLLGWFKGRKDEQKKQEKEKRKALQDRLNVEDASSKLPGDSIRKRLRKWAIIRRVRSDKANDE